MRHLLPRLVLCILALAPTASAQIAMPEGVALSPFPVLQSPVEYTTFDETGGGIWAVFLGAQSGSGLYVQHIRADGSFENDFSAAARGYAKSGTLVNNISSAPDGVGGVVVTWFGVNAKDSTSQYLALRFTHILNDGSIPGTTIPDTGIVVSTIASAAMVIGDGRGGAYVVWEELKGPSNPDLYAQHYDYWGHPMWTPLGSPTGIPVCAVVGIQRLRAIHSDGAGGAYVVWADSRVGTTAPLYVAHLVDGGVQAGPWTANGVRVSPATQGIRIVGSAVSPTGSLWLAWRDLNIPGQFYAQQVGVDAAFAWTPLGAIVATVQPLRAEFAPGTSGSTFVTWGGSDVRCSRLDASGVRVWTTEPTGRVLATPVNGADVAHTAADGAGGQRIAWSTDVAGQSDVYSLRVDGAGAPLAGEPAGGDLVEAGPAAQVPVAWYDAATASPVIVWLQDGQLRARRLLSSTTSVEPLLGNGPVLAAPSPNPWRGDALLARFKAPRGEATLSLFDVTGRRVLARSIRSEGGEQSVSLSGAGALEPGIYLLALDAGGYSVARRVVRTR